MVLIRCPACDHRFQVDSKDQPNTAPDVVEGSSSKEAGHDHHHSRGTPRPPPQSDVITCPSCTARLKVPLERRPTRARCPACRTESRASNPRIADIRAESVVMVGISRSSRTNTSNPCSSSRSGPRCEVRTGQLADHLDLSPQSVTEMSNASIGVASLNWSRIEELD